jgi:hypothetical protein
MADSEYERLKSAIEQQYIHGLELLREGYLAKLRALEERAPSAEADRHKPGAETLASPATPAAETQTDTLASPETQGATRLAVQALASETPRSGVMYDILDVFPRLPEVFDKTDIASLLGYIPSRTAVHRATSRLLAAKKIELVQGGHGRRLSKYRKLKPV